MHTLTSDDLEQWSGRAGVEFVLPSLVRRLIMAWAAPGSVRMPAAGGVRSPGFDGVIFSEQEVQFVPEGWSFWELSSEGSPGGKATRDYNKRVEAVFEAERAVTTYVAVTSRKWPGADGWVAERRGSANGWADVRALDAEDLATWLEQCPSVNGWLAAHLGRAPWGAEPLRDWYASWSATTTPAVPPALLLAGRELACAKLQQSLASTASVSTLLAPTREEVTAFVGACLLADPPTGDASGVDADASPTVAGSDTLVEPAVVTAEVAAREALLERAVVVESLAAWRELVAQERPLVLVSMLPERPDTAMARDAGHHVVLPDATDPVNPLALPRLDRERARVAWRQSGVSFAASDEYARQARRSLSAWRRRHRPGADHPSWSRGANAATLVSFLLAGAWRDEPDHPGDLEVVTSLCGREWRQVERELRSLAAGEDPPLAPRYRHWWFVDVLDAWEQLRATVTIGDLDEFHRQVLAVLGERHPLVDVDANGRWHAMLSDPAAARMRHSETLRKGMATTLAVLGAELQSTPLADARTGQQHADAAVRELLEEATAERWLSVAPLLPALAEAAPRVFCEQVEAALEAPGGPLASLASSGFTVNGLGDGSRWLCLALEPLMWSRHHLIRVAVIAARLLVLDLWPSSDTDPLRNRLGAALHLAFPQSAVRAEAHLRTRALDGIRQVAPSVAFTLITSLVKERRRGGLIHPGPRWRDWADGDEQSTAVGLRQVGLLAQAATTDLVQGLLHQAEHDPDRWTTLFDLYGQLDPDDREHLLQSADQVWSALPGTEHHRVLAPLRKVLALHLRHADQEWAFPGADRARLIEFLDRHDTPDAAHLDLFTTSWPDLPGVPLDHPDWDAEADRRRVQAASQLFERHGLEGLLDLARPHTGQSPAPELLGRALSGVSAVSANAVLDLLDTSDQTARPVVNGYVARRTQLDPTWIHTVVAERPAHTAELLSALPISSDLIDLVAAQPAETRTRYWSQVWPTGVPSELATAVTEQLVEIQRPLAAIWTLTGALREYEPPPELVIRALLASHEPTETAAEWFATHLDFMVPALLDYLEGCGIAVDTLASIEIRYLEIFDPSLRAATNTGRLLARDPALFAQLAALAYTPANTTEDNHSSSQPPRGVTSVAMRRAAQILHNWRQPLPGSLDGMPPTVEQTQAWIQHVRENLDAAGSADITALVLGPALSGPDTDPDGTWPSAPVRAALEQQDDDHLDEELACARYNNHDQRPSRGIYQGSTVEEGIATHYRNEADEWRPTYPHTATVLNTLADLYENEATQTGRNADLRADD